MKRLLLSFALFAWVLASGCWWDDCGSNSVPSGGFAVRTADVMLPACAGDPVACIAKTLMPVRIPHPGVYVKGTQVCDLGVPGCVGYVPEGSYGSVYHFGDSSAGDPPAVTSGSGVSNNPWAEYYVQNGRVNALWNSQVLDWSASAFYGTPPCQNTSTDTKPFQVTLYAPYIDWECAQIANVGPVGPFPGNGAILVGSLPPTITFSNPALALTTSSGMPGLHVFDEAGADIATSAANTQECGIIVQPPPPNQPQIIAISVSPDGTSVTFPFPKLSNGSPLPEGFYGFNIWNQSSPGQFVDAGMGFFAVSKPDISHTTPFGIDVGQVSYSGQTCYFDGLNTYCGGSWGPNISSVLITTLSSLGQVAATNGTITVGSKPTAIKAYGTSDVYTSTDSYGSWQEVVQPANAIVTNFGSNTVSILDLVNNLVAKTIPVGTQPVTVVLNSNQSKAYVANYGSSTVSEIDLTYNTQSRVTGLGLQPEALAMDPSGTALWVGGLNYISKVDLSSFSVVQSFSVSGQVTSLAVSAGLNTLVYTTVATSGGSTTFQAQQAAISTGAVQHTYAQQTISSSSSYAQIITTGGPAPGAPGWLMSSGALVSANYVNSVVVVGTPTGFAVVDLARQTNLLAEDTPNPVRGIATVPGQGAVYLTIPDSNLVLTVPLPAQHTPAQGTVTISGSEQTVTFNPCSPYGGYCPQTAPDSGYVTVMVADAQVSTNYGQGDTAATVAGRLAQQMSSMGFPVTGYVSGNTITLYANMAGTGPNQWPLQANCQSNFAQYGVGCSFWASPSGSTLSGGN